MINIDVEYYNVCFSYRRPDGRRVSRQNQIVKVVLDEGKLPNCNHDEAESVIKIEYKDRECIIHDVNIYEFKI